MKAVVVRTTNEVSIEDLGEPLHMHTQPILGGMIETVHPMRLKRPYLMLVNDSGLLRDLNINPLGCYLYGTDKRGSSIVGNIIIMKEVLINRWGERDICGLTDQEAQGLKNLFDDLIYKFQIEEDNENER